MPTYTVLVQWHYEPARRRADWKEFKPGDTIAYPGTAFPTELPIQYLLDKKVVELIA